MIRIKTSNAVIATRQIPTMKNASVESTLDGAKVAMSKRMRDSCSENLQVLLNQNPREMVFEKHGREQPLE